MRVIHFSDTHLGHQQFSKIDPKSGLNQREQDHYDVFRTIIDRCVEVKPDLVIHSGDLFDGVRPSNRALAQALEGFVRLDRAGIPTVIIAGNHEHPKMLETGSPFRLFEHLENIHPVYKGKREDIKINGTTIHAVPQCPDNQGLREAVDSITETGGILVLHGGVMGIEAFHHAEFNELSLDPAWFTGANANRFSYVALGHYHGCTEIAPNAWYAGAPDRVSIREAGEEKGWLEVEIGAHAEVTFRPYPGRPYADLPIIKADNLDANEILQAAQLAIQGVPDGAVARLRIWDIPGSLRSSLDLHAIRKASARLLDLDLDLRFADDQHFAETGIGLRGIAQEFEEYAATYPLEGMDRDELLSVARDLLSEAA